MGAALTNTMDDDRISFSSVWVGHISKNVADIHTVWIHGARAAAILLILVFFTHNRRQTKRPVARGLPPCHSAQTEKQKVWVKLTWMKSMSRKMVTFARYFLACCFLFRSSWSFALLAAASSLLFLRSSSSASLRGFLFLVGIPTATERETWHKQTNRTCNASILMYSTLREKCSSNEHEWDFIPVNICKQSQPKQKPYWWS